MLSRLVCRNVKVNGRRTSMRMEPNLWESLDDIANREKRTVHDLVSEIDARIKAASSNGVPGARRSDSAAETISLTASVRVFIVSYFRAAATEERHREVGHGGNPFAGTPFDSDASASATETPAPTKRRGSVGTQRPVLP